MDTIIPYAAAADLSAKFLHAVKDNGSGAAAAITADTDAPIGILQNKPAAAGKSCTIDREGVKEAILGGTVAKGDLLGPNSAGALVKRTLGTDGTKYVMAVAGAAGVSGDIIPVALVQVPFLAVGYPVPSAGIDALAITTAKLAAAAVTKAKAAVFFSTEQTGTGSSQNVAHGLGAVPAGVLVALTELAAGLAAGADVAEGAHDATNVVVTVTTGLKFKVLAWA